MSLKFCSFASGSSGNSYLVKDDDTSIIIDAGISGKRILEGLDATGTPRGSVRAILVTHEHIDHVKSLPVLTKRLPLTKRLRRTRLLLLKIRLSKMLPKQRKHRLRKKSNKK